MPDPVARNRAITDAYHDLSRDFDDVIDHGQHEHPNWCTFASHASNSVGRTIRGEDTRWLRSAAKIGGMLLNMAASLIGGSIGASLKDLKHTGDSTFTQASARSAEGNLRVFSEIGPEFARYVEEQPTPRTLPKYLEHFAPDQSMLAEAFADYTAARFAPDEKTKEELIWAGNCLIGAHEQGRLQDQIAKALPSFGRTLITTHMLALALPDQTVYLGEDVPKRADGTDYPPCLEQIDDPRARAALPYYHHDANSLKGSAARDWTSYDERMNFIVDLFRSNGDNRHLFKTPK